MILPVLLSYSDTKEQQLWISVCHPADLGLRVHWPGIWCSVFEEWEMVTTDNRTGLWHFISSVCWWLRRINLFGRGKALLVFLLPESCLFYLQPLHTFIAKSWVMEHPFMVEPPAHSKPQWLFFLCKEKNFANTGKYRDYKVRNQIPFLLCEKE